MNIKLIYLLAPVFLIFAQPAYPFKTDVYVSGTDGYAYYRIPAIIKVGDGVLLAFCEGRKSNWRDHGNIDLLVKRSMDGGKTWSRTILIWSDGNNTCGNPCPVFDEITGKVWLFSTHNLGRDRYADIANGTSQGTRTIWVTSSSDNGLTWAPMKDITLQVKLPTWRWYATGPGNGIQIKNGIHAGRLVVPICHGNPNGAGVFYSDDQGVSWRRGQSRLGISGVSAGETQVVEAFDQSGKLILNTRSSGGYRTQSVSTDGGATWATPWQVMEQTDPPCQASVLRWEDRTMQNGNGILLFSNPASNIPKERRKLTVRLSADDGRTWPESVLICEGWSAYSSLVRVDNTTPACLYENGIGGIVDPDDSTNNLLYKKITFQTFLFPTPVIKDFPVTITTGQELTIDGENFIGVREVLLGSVSVPFRVHSGTRITVIIPPRLNASGLITIRCNDGRECTSMKSFTFFAAPDSPVPPLS